MEIKNRQLPEYAPGDTVNDIFVVRFKKPVRMTKTGKYFFELKLQDAKGEIMFKFWGNENKETVEELYNSIRQDSVIKVVNGKVGMFNDVMDISVDRSEGKVMPLNEGEYNINDFIASSEKNPDAMMKELSCMMETIRDPDMKTVLDSFFKDENFVQRFKYSPAAMYRHHGWTSGLLEHTLTVVKICDDISRHHPKLDRDLLLAGAALHDIGKIEEFETTTQIKVSDKGNLLGHIPLGIQMLTRKLDLLDVPGLLKDKLMHMIISHHGKLEFGSPKTPGFPEAMVLNKADELDAFTTDIMTQKENAKTEDSFVFSKGYGNIYLK